MATAFDHATRVVRDGADGRYDAELSDGWTALPGTPNGGYCAAVCTRALALETGLPDPLCTAVVFGRRARPGRAEVRTRVLRAGRRLTTAHATLHQGGGEVLRVSACFTDLARAAGRSGPLLAPPDLPPPDACVDLAPHEVLRGVTIAERFDYRVAALPGWRRGRPTGVPVREFWLRFADGRSPDVLALATVVDAGERAVFELGEFASLTIELTLHVRARPAPGWLACRVTTRHLADGCYEEDCEVWDAAGTLVAQSRQLAVLLDGASAQHAGRR